MAQEAMAALCLLAPLHNDAAAFITAETERKNAPYEEAIMAAHARGQMTNDFAQFQKLADEYIKKYPRGSAEWARLPSLVRSGGKEMVPYCERALLQCVRGYASLPVRSVRGQVTATSPARVVRTATRRISAGRASAVRPAGGGPAPAG